jgi:hypothetical protein
MTAVTQQFLPYGFRRAKIFKLTAAVPVTANANGAVDDGTYIEGAVSLELTIPTPRTITGFGNDGITQIGTLPPQEAIVGTLSAEAFSDALWASATGVKTTAESEAKVTPVGTDTQGSEPLFMLIASRLCTGLTDGADVYQTVIIPACKFIPAFPGMTGDKAAVTWSIQPRRVKKFPNGIALTRAANGCLAADFFSYTTENPLNLCLWLGDNTVTEFLFPTDWQSISDAKSELYHYGATEPATWADHGYTPTTKPSAAYTLLSIYETPAIAA